MTHTARKNPILMAMDTVSACMKPVVPVLLGCGLIKLLVLLVGLTGAWTHLGDTEALIGHVDSAPFYFLPMLLAYTSAAHFGCNPCYAIASVAVMLFPDFMAMMEAGEAVTFLGVPVMQANYAYGVVPVIVLVYVMKWVQRAAERWIPAAVRDLFAPMAVILICGVLGVVAIGPVISLLSGLLSGGIGFLQANYPVAAWVIMCACLPLFVMTGTHWIFVTVMLEQLGTTGMESGFHVSCFVLSMTLTGACLAVFLKSHGEMRKTALSAGVTALATGTSEPGLFGVCLPNRTPLIAIIVAGGIAGVWQGLRGLHSYVYAFPGIFSILMFSSPAEPDNLPGVLIAGGIGFAAALLIALILYREQPGKDA